MKTVALVSIWDQRRYWEAGGKDVTIGVNWSAVGSVTPATARRFAHQVLLVADRAQARSARLKKLNYELVDPEAAEVAGGENDD